MLLLLPSFTAGLWNDNQCCSTAECELVLCGATTLASWVSALQHLEFRRGLQWNYQHGMVPKAHLLYLSASLMFADKCQVASGSYTCCNPWKETCRNLTQGLQKCCAKSELAGLVNTFLPCGSL